MPIHYVWQPGYHSQYSDLLRAVKSGVWTLVWDLGLTQPPIQVPGPFPVGKVAGVWA